MGDARGAATFQTPAEAYDRHVGRYSRKLARAFIDAAGVRNCQRTLDVGSGPGALTTELVALLGHDRVAAVEPSAPFAEAARRRLPGVQVESRPPRRFPSRTTRSTTRWRSSSSTS